MKILFAAGEVHPFIKTGGLADVAYALPKALRGMGVDCRVILPNYLEIPQEYKDKMKNIMNFEVNVGTKKVRCSIEYLEYENIPVYFVGNEFYFGRKDIYGHSDDDERFTFFSKAVVEMCLLDQDFHPDIIHCNDWHTAIISLIAKNEKIKTVLTIHNLRYQGLFKKDIISDLLPEDADGLVSFMKLGIINSDQVTTVSETYSKEITLPELGEGLETYLKGRGDSLTGIVNGLDYDLYNPETDEDVYSKYDCSNRIQGKKINKSLLQKYLGIDVNEDIPIVAMVSRIANEKGFDLITAALDELMKMNIQLVILGTGDKGLEELLQDYSAIYPDKLSANIMFSNKLAKKIYAGSDMFLMPSFYEPCGLSQLIALRYGSVPIVRETGGLKDTVVKFDEERDTGTGFVFKEYDRNVMLGTIEYALSIYKQKEKWDRLATRGMLTDNSWERSAKLYIELYESLLK
jgi:starch synthase